MAFTGEGGGPEAETGAGGIAAAARTAHAPPPRPSPYALLPASPATGSSFSTTLPPQRRLERLATPMARLAALNADEAREAEGQQPATAAAVTAAGPALLSRRRPAASNLSLPPSLRRVRSLRRVLFSCKNGHLCEA